MICLAYYNDGMVGHMGTTAPFADSYQEGDVIGVKVNFSRCCIEVSKNGTLEGIMYLQHC